MNAFVFTILLLLFSPTAFCLAPIQTIGSKFNGDNGSGPNGEKGQTRVKAPLVDSTLLRFLSSQKKKNGSVALKDDNERATVGGKTIPVERRNGRKSRGVEVDVPSFDPLIGLEEPANGKNWESTAASTINDAVGGDPFKGQLWMQQFGAQRIATKLRSLGVNGPTANDAGKNIQDYILGRVARRQIRKFLKERDALWESISATTSENKEGVRGSMTLAAANKFDIDDVICVLSESGLTGNDIAAVFTHTPSIAMMRARRISENISYGTSSGKTDSVEDTLERAVVGLLGETLKLRRYDARKVLRSCPGLLSPRGSASAEQVVKLMVNLGSSTSSIARDKASLPTLLSRSPALLFRLVAFLSSAQLQVPMSAIGPILRRKQSIEMLNAVAPVRSAPVSSYGGLEGVVGKESITAVDVGMEILGYFQVDETTRGEQIDDSYHSMRAVTHVLRRKCDVGDFQKIVASNPQVFFRNATDIEAIATYLREDVGMSRADIRKAIHTFPSLLELDITQIKSVVEYLLMLHVEEEVLPSIFKAFPSTLAIDIEHIMVPAVEFLREIGVRDLGRFITRLPPVLGYNVEEDLRPRWDFLREVCQFEYFEIVRFPAYFSYPLDRVIKARYEYLRDCKNIPIRLASIDDVLRFGDRDFATKIALDDDDGAAFARFVHRRGASNSQNPKSRSQMRHPLRQP